MAPYIFVMGASRILSEVLSKIHGFHTEPQSDPERLPLQICRETFVYTSSWRLINKQSYREGRTRTRDQLGTKRTLLNRGRGCQK